MQGLNLSFYKMEAAGNDFILLDLRKDRRRYIGGIRYRDFCSKYCSRKKGVGADGVLLIEKSKKHAFKMRIFNPDGSEAEMCGNGARCSALWFLLSGTRGGKARGAQSVLKFGFETKAGIISAVINRNNKLLDKDNSRAIKIKLTDPFGFKEDIKVKVLGRTLKVNFINTGVPHLVVFVHALERIDVKKIGKVLRFHRKFQPAGANVNFVEFLNRKSISIRTYERGVEDETFACGTGAVASGIIANYKLGLRGKNIWMKVITSRNDELTVYSDCYYDRIDNVCSSGRARLVYEGVII